MLEKFLKAAMDAYREIEGDYNSDFQKSLFKHFDKALDDEKKDEAFTRRFQALLREPSLPRPQSYRQSAHGIKWSNEIKKRRENA